MEFALAMTLSIVGSIMGDFLMKQAASPVTAERALPSARARLLRNLRFWGGMVMLSLHFIGFLTALKLAPVSIVIPLMSCTYIGTTILAATVLKEQIKPLRWVGIGIIMAGMVLLFR